MASYLYNGVELPALICYNAAVFSCAYISRNVGKTACVLTVAAERPVYGPDPEDSTKNGVYHYGLSRSYIVDGGAWQLQVEGEGFVCTSEDIGTVIWTNTDILDGSGNVYLAASDPEPAAAGLSSFQMGLALGLCGKSLPLAKDGGNIG